MGFVHIKLWKKSKRHGFLNLESVEKNKKKNRILILWYKNITTGHDNNSFFPIVFLHMQTSKIIPGGFLIIFSWDKYTISAQVATKIGEYDGCFF